MTGRPKQLNWTQNIENIFTKEELNSFVKSGHLEKVWRSKRYYYIKKGCKQHFQNTKRENSNGN